MQINLFCSGSKGNSCLIQTTTTKVLVDCGPSTKRYMTNSLKDVDVKVDDLDAVLITHSHSDHIRQLAMFQCVPIYTCCPLQVKNSKREEVPLDLHMITPPAQFGIGDLVIQAFPTSHDSGPSMGFVIYHENEKLVYVTDTGYIKADYFDLLSECRLLYFRKQSRFRNVATNRSPILVKSAYCLRYRTLM